MIINYQRWPPFLNRIMRATLCNNFFFFLIAYLEDNFFVLFFRSFLLYLGKGKIHSRVVPDTRPSSTRVLSRPTISGPLEATQ